MDPFNDFMLVILQIYDLLICDNQVVVILCWVMHWITHLYHISICSNFSSPFTQQQSQTTSRTVMSGTPTLCYFPI